MRQSPRHRQKLPWQIILIASIAVAFFLSPFIGLLWRTPWSKFTDIVTRREIRDALWLSVQTSLITSIVCFVFGVPLAWLLARVDFRGRRFIRALMTLSMVLPPVIGGIALLFTFGRRGLIGQYLDSWFGIRLPFTTTAVVMAQCFVAMPFLVLTVEAALRQLDTRFEDVARTLGGSRWYVFRRVTLPSIKPSLFAGLVLAWARALGEFGATITFAGNLPGTTQTMPLATYAALDSNPESALILSLLMIAIAFSILIALRDRWLGRTEQGLPL
jgi:molybdate transport system permease protein